ncbi:MAG: hypothetical protein ACK475_04215 [Bacteroidota bacterium]|jgi:hypothetical protein
MLQLLSLQPIMRIPSLLVLSALIALSAVGASAQRLKGSSTPLGPDEKPIYTWYGLYVGPSFNSQGGTFATSCDCDFTGGAGTGLVAGLMVEHRFRSGLTIGTLVGYEGRGISGRFREVEGVVQTSPTGQSYNVPITFLNEATLSFDMVSFNPYVKSSLVGNLFGRAGLSLGYVVSSDLTHTKSLQTPRVTLPDGEVADVVFGENGSGSVTLENGPYADLSSFQIGGTISAGYEIPLARDRRPWGMDVTAVLVPVVQYFIPVTQLSLNNGDLRVSTLQFMLEFRYNL